MRQVRNYFKSEGLKILAPLRLTAQKSCPLKKCVPEKFVTLPCNNILSIQYCTLRIHMSVTLRQFFIGIKKLLVFTIFTKPIFFFLLIQKKHNSSITTEQFNNHTSSSMTTHQFIARKLHVAAEKNSHNCIRYFLIRMCSIE